MSQNRTVEQKVGDTARAYQALRDEVSAPELRALFTQTQETANTVLASIEPNSEMSAAGALAQYQALVQTALSIGRVLAANDRAALMAAAVITQSGVVRPILEDPTE